MEVRENPSGELARACHGLRIHGETIWGKVLPVSYERAIQITLRLVDNHAPRLVIGTGVSRRDISARLERFGYRDYSDVLPDNDGQIGRRPNGPERMTATVDVEHLATCMGVDTSTDPGRYVCNAWLYEVALGAPESQVGFLHVPGHGFSRERFIHGLEAYLTRRRVDA